MLSTIFSMGSLSSGNLSFSYGGVRILGFF